LFSFIFPSFGLGRV
jgi:hypothetical protein